MFIMCYYKINLVFHNHYKNKEKLILFQEDNDRRAF